MNTKFLSSVVLILVILFSSVGVFPRHTFADSTTVSLFPDSYTDSTWLGIGNPLNRVARTYDSRFGQVTQLQTLDCPSNAYASFAENGVSWPPNTSYDQNEDKYLEFNFPASNIPVNAIIDNVSVVNQYFTSLPIVDAKLEFWDSDTTLLSSSELTVPLPACFNAASDTIAISGVDTVAKLDALTIRLLALAPQGVYGQVYTDEDYMRLDVTYHLPDAPPVAYSQDFPNQSVDAPLPITLTATSTNNNALTYSIVSTSTLGTLGAVSGNQVTYTPNGTLGNDSFIFQADDGTFSATSTITIHTVAGSTTALNISADSPTLTVGSSTTLTISGHDQFGNPTTSDNTTLINVSSDIGSVVDSILTLNSGVATTTGTSNVAGVVQYFASSTSIVSATTSVLFSDPVVATSTATSTVSQIQPVERSGGGGGGGLLAVSSQQSSAPVVTSTPVATPPASVNLTVNTTDTTSGPSAETPADTPVVSENDQPSQPPVSVSSDNTTTNQDDSSSAATDTVATESSIVATSSSLGASVINSGIDDTSGEKNQKPAVIVFGILLIGAIYTFVWHPFRKKG